MNIRLAVLAGVLTLLATACSAGGLGGGGTYGDMLALVPADEEFLITFGDLDAHREAVGATAPPADAPDGELAEHLETLVLAGEDQLRAAGATLGFNDQTGNLLPLARGSTYVLDKSGTEVIRGDFADDAFGHPEEDDGLERVPVENGYGLVVEGGTVTVARERDALDATLAAQRGDAESMADVPEAVRLVAALDDIDVIHGLAVSYGNDGAIDGVASGVADNPDSEGTWHLVVAHNPGTGAQLDAVTDALDGLAREFAERHDAEVVEVASHDGVAAATIRVDDPNIWLLLQRNFDPLLFGGFNPSS